jgi:glucose dehydrogenase
MCWAAELEVTPIKVRDTVYLCSQHQRLFAVDAKSGTLRWSYDPKLYQVAMTSTLWGFQGPVISIRCPGMRIG